MQPPPQDPQRPSYSPQQPQQPQQPYYQPQGSPPPQQPYYQQPPAPMPPYQPPKPPPERNFLKWFQGLSLVKKIGVILIALFILSAAVNGMLQSNTPAATQTDTPTTVAQATKPTATAKPQPAQYPPKTQADLRGLAAEGDASAIHTFKSESTGIAGTCPQPKRLITVDPGITGRQLAQDLLAYFYSNQIDSPCGSIVFAYHQQAEVNGDFYTAGRINFDVTDSSGNINFDPNGTDLKHKLTLDVGGFMANQKEYVVTY